MNVFSIYTPLHRNICKSIDSLLGGNSIFLDFNRGFLYLLFQALYIRFRYRDAVFFVGNPKKTKSRVFFKLMKPDSICFFDDGIGSVNGVGYFFDFKPSWHEKLLRFLLFVPFYKEIVGAVDVYYTIYNENSYCQPRRYAAISLIDESRKELLNMNKPFVLIIGSALYNDKIVSRPELDKVYSYINERLVGFDYFYLLHPREDKNIALSYGIDLKKIISCGESENFIVSNKENIIKVYSFYSSLLMYCDGLEVDALITDSLRYLHDSGALNDLPGNVVYI